MASYPVDRSGSPSTTTAEESPPPTSPGGTLVVREKYEAPTRDDPIPQLPAPPSDAIASPRGMLGGYSATRAAKGALFLMKMLSITTFCSPVASNGNVAYPILAIAVVDLCLEEPHLLISVALLVLHMIALFGSRRMGMLCQPRASIWEEY